MSIYKILESQINLQGRSTFYDVVEMLNGEAIRITSVSSNSMKRAIENFLSGSTISKYELPNTLKLYDNRAGIFEFNSVEELRNMQKNHPEFFI